jgi:hypothetical protein
MTSDRLQPNNLRQMELPLMSSAVGSRARIYPLQARVRDLKASAADYGQKSPDFLASYDPATSLWKTSQPFLIEGLTEYLGTWPRSGLVVSGIAYQLPPLVLLTDEIASGLWPTPRTTGLDGGSNSRKAAKARGMWPTPLARDTKGRDSPRRKGGASLPQIIWQETGSGRLNPTFVEWLMGFPIGHTELEPSETP